MKIIPGGPENCIKNPDVPTPIGMAFAKGDPAFAKFLTDLVTEMRPKIDASLARHSSLEHDAAEVAPPSPAAGRGA